MESPWSPEILDPWLNFQMSTMWVWCLTYDFMCCLWFHGTFHKMVLYYFLHIYIYTYIYTHTYTQIYLYCGLNLKSFMGLGKCSTTELWLQPLYSYFKIWLTFIKLQEKLFLEPLSPQFIKMQSLFFCYRNVVLPASLFVLTGLAAVSTLHFVRRATYTSTRQSLTDSRYKLDSRRLVLSKSVSPHWDR